MCQKAEVEEDLFLPTERYVTYTQKHENSGWLKTQAVAFTKEFNSTMQGIIHEVKVSSVTEVL